MEPPRTELDDQRAGAETWRRYLENRDVHSRNALVVFYAPLVKFIAGRIAARTPAWVAFDDLVSTGVEGLIDAVERFDPEAGVYFETYAAHRVKGAIIDAIRQSDRIPRSVRAVLRAIDDGTDELVARVHRPPTEDELVAHLELSRRTIRTAQRIRRDARVLSLDEIVVDEEGVRRSVASGNHTAVLEVEDSDPAILMEGADEWGRIADALRGLSERERQVVTLYYLEELPLSEVGAILGVTESRISQIQSQAIAKLRGTLGVTRVLGSSRVHTKRQSRRSPVEALAS